MIDSQSNACHRLLHTVMMCQYVEERGNKRQKSHVAHGLRSRSFHDGNGVWIMRIASLLLTGQPLSNSCTPYVLVYAIATNHQFHCQNANVHVSFPNAHALTIKWVWLPGGARSRKIFSRKMTLCKFAKILLHKNIHVYGRFVAMK